MLSTLLLLPAPWFCSWFLRSGSEGCLVLPLSFGQNLWGLSYLSSKMGVLSQPASPLRVLCWSEKEEVLTASLDVASLWLMWAQAHTCRRTYTHSTHTYTHMQTWTPMDILVCVYFWHLYSAFLIYWYVFVSLLIPHSLDCSNYVWKSSGLIPLTLFF